MKTNVTMSIDSDVILEARAKIENLSAEVEKLLIERLSLTTQTENTDALKRKINALTAHLKQIEEKKITDQEQVKEL